MISLTLNILVMHSIQPFFIFASPSPETGHLSLLFDIIVIFLFIIVPSFLLNIVWFVSFLKKDHFDKLLKKLVEYMPPAPKKILEQEARKRMKIISANNDDKSLKHQMEEIIKARVLAQESNEEF